MLCVCICGNNNWHLNFFIIAFDQYTKQKDVGLQAIAIAKNESNTSFVFATKTTINDSTYPLTQSLFVNIKSDINTNNTDLYGNFTLKIIQEFMLFGLNTKLGAILTEEALDLISLLRDQLQQQVNKIKNISKLLSPTYDPICGNLTTTGHSYHGSISNHTQYMPKHNFWLGCWFDLEC